MIKKTVTYTDYDGEERTDDLFFNLSDAEMLELEMSTEGGLDKMIKRIIAAKNTEELIKLFKSMLTLSYGEKSPDGRRFIKSEELTNNFLQTEAYSQLFLELALDAEKASEFVNGIVSNVKLKDHLTPTAAPTPIHQL